MTRLVTIGYDLPSSRWNAETAGLHADIYAGVAIHPNEAHASTPEVLAEIEELARLPHVRAVGETGLDTLFGHLGIAGEAVEHHHSGGALLGQHPQHVVVRLAVVNDQRLAGALGDLDVRPEAGVLLVLGRPVAEVVQPGLPHRPDLRQPGQRLDLGQGLRREACDSLGWMATPA